MPEDFDTGCLDPIFGLRLNSTGMLPGPNKHHWILEFTSGSKEICCNAIVCGYYMQYVSWKVTSSHLSDSYLQAQKDTVRLSMPFGPEKAAIQGDERPLLHSSCSDVCGSCCACQWSIQL